MTFDLNKTIRQAIQRSKDPDPHVIARKLYAKMTHEQRELALADCLADRVRIEITRARMCTHAGDIDISSNGSRPRTGGVSRWQTATRNSVFVPEVGWKFEVELTADDCKAMAAVYASRAVAMDTKAREYAERAVLLERSGCETWGDFLKTGDREPVS